MRSLVTYAVAAVAVLGLPVAGYGQRTAGAKSSLAQCDWQPIGQLRNFAPRDLAVTPAGAILVTGDDLSSPGHTALVTLRWDGPGATWQEVDRFLPEGSTDSGARAMEVDADGNVYVLAWDMNAGGTELLLRRSLGAGEAGTWESSETHWVALEGGALASDPDGRIHVAYAFGGPEGIGWRVVSAPRGSDDFAVEDELRVNGAYRIIPGDMTRAGDGSLYVVGQLHGETDEWIVRGTSASRKGAWVTLDRFRAPVGTSGAAARAVTLLPSGRPFVAGLAQRPGGADFQWVERWLASGDRWQTRRFQLQTGKAAMAEDAAATPSGIAVLGVGMTSEGTTLVMRETSASGNRPPQIVLELPGVTDLWSARLAVGRKQAAVATGFGDGAAVIACSLR